MKPPLQLFEPVEFIVEFLLDKLRFSKTDDPISIHITCSMTKMKLRDKMVKLANLCSSSVLVPEEVGCCGFAGDKGFTQPEVNQYALRKLRPQIEKKHIRYGYSNSRTCEIGLTTHSGISYQSIVYLVDRCTERSIVRFRLLYTKRLFRMCETAFSNQNAPKKAEIKPVRPYSIEMALAGFSFASSRLGMNTLRTPFA